LPKHTSTERQGGFGGRIKRRIKRVGGGGFPVRWHLGAGLPLYGPFVGHEGLVAKLLEKKKRREEREGR